MKETIENVCAVVDEYGADLCDIDMLVRTEGAGKFLSCADCIFNGIDKKFGLDIAGCPYECTGDEDILR